MSWKGEWVAGDYKADDSVQYEGSSYIAAAAATVNDVPGTSPAWQLVAAKGNAGAQGLPGADGATGPAGPAGPAGPQGPKGDTGATGPQGPQGLKGDTGATGATGPQGPQGPAGSPDTQAQIIEKIATATTGAVLTMKQAETESASAFKLAVTSSTGLPKFGISADGTLLINTSTLDSSGSKLNVVNENNNSTFAFDSYANYYSFGGGGLFRFSRGSHAVKAPVQNGDRLGYFLFSGYDGSSFVNSTGVSSKVDGPVSAGVVPAKIAFETGNPRVERLVINSSGNIGLGTSAPTQRLEVSGGVRINPATTKPTCDSTSRGTFWFTQGTVGAKDQVEVCAKDAANQYDWRPLY
ncbi:collagen-like protein [Geomonas ferrireducens]|uniref:collagen-like protein n=1 Tax=Geomonas ferrireducens TaxID=2570227 RepID=UPI0018E07D83|nr:collagen-like protein [Geomonas ferrireducens]